MAAYTANQVSINNGQKNVVVNSNESPEGVSKGDFIHVGTFTPMEINRTYVDSSGKHVIELLKAWGNSNQSNQPAIVIPTTVQFKDTVKALQTANRLLNDNTQAMQDWQTKTGTVAFVDAAGVSQIVKTLKQMQIENDALHPYPWAMRKVEFEAKRKQNNEMFAASGFVHFGKHADTAATPRINEGMFVRSDGQYTQGWHGSKVWLGRNDSYAAGNSKEESPTINITGVLTTLYHSSGMQDPFDGASCVVKFAPAEDGTRTYDVATGISVTHATPAIAFASETETNKVVTERVDVWGFEAYLREVNDADPFVYGNGLIQSSVTSISGITTTSDNVRPITYFAWYEGDTGSRGKGVNWQAASEASRIKIASDPSHNIYFDDATGKFYQWCVRGRSFAGLGNGDWARLEGHIAQGDISFSELSNTRLIAQGILDYKEALGTDAGASSYLGYKHSGRTQNSDVGSLSCRSGAVSAVQGECYFLVCGTVSRLNQGAYHPSLNPLGTGGWADSSSGANINESQTWAELWNRTTMMPKTKFDAFNQVAQATTDFSRPGVFKYASGKLSGSLGSLVAKRPDGRFYDAIYASGQGGLGRDMRYSAWGLKAEDFSNVDSKVKSGEYRGRERLVKTTFHMNAYKAYVAGSNATHTLYHSGPNSSGSKISFHSNNMPPNTPIIVFQPSSGLVMYGKVSGSDGYLLLSLLPRNRSRNASNSLEAQQSLGLVDPIYIAEVVDIDTSISEKYIHTDIVGDPAKILQCEDLKKGWIGSWIPVIPDGTVDNFPLNRKYTGSGSDILRTYTTNDGAGWTSGRIPLSDIHKNETQFSKMPTGQVTLYQYPATTVMTEEGLNSEIHGWGTKALGVLVNSNSSANEAALFSYSLTGRIHTDTAYANLKNSNLAITNTSNSLSGSLKETKYAPWAETRHQPITIGPPLNNSTAAKSLSYDTVTHQQGFINYAYTELKHDGTDWGDDGKINIVNNQSTRTDDNGNTVLYGTARIVEPLGWVKK